MDIFIGKETRFSQLLKSTKKKQIFISLRKNIEKKTISFLKNPEKKTIYIIGSLSSKKINKLNYTNVD
jgi:hypothetical protein